MSEHVVALAAAQAKAEAAVVQALEADLNQAVIDQALVKKVAALKVVAVIKVVKDQVVAQVKRAQVIVIKNQVQLQHLVTKSIIKFSKGLKKEKQQA